MDHTLAPRVVALLLLPSCGGTLTSGGADDAGVGEGGTIGYGSPVFVDHIANDGGSAATGCLPQALVPDSAGDVACIVLVSLPALPQALLANEALACKQPSLGLFPPPSNVLDAFNETAHAAWERGGRKGPDPSLYATCELRQIAFTKGASCAARDAMPGWCYVQGGACTQGIAFGPGSLVPGSTMYIECTGY